MQGLRRRQHLRAPAAERNKCKDCSGSGICEHQRQRNSCKDCLLAKDAAAESERTKKGERERGTEWEREKELGYGGGSAGDRCRAQMGGRAGGRAREQVERFKETEPDTHGINRISTKHNSQGADGDKVAVEYKLEVLSEGGAAGVGVGDCGRDAQDMEDDQKVWRAASHEMESNVGSKSKRSDSAPHMGWREYIAVSGRLYYHPKATKTTQ